MERDAAVVDVDTAFVLRSLFGEAEAEQVEANRRAARQCEFLAEVLAHARAHPDLYVDTISNRPAAALMPLGGEAELAVRCAVLEASSRLRMSEQHVRTWASLAEQARSELPRLWQSALDGFISIEHVKAAQSQLTLFAEHADQVAGFDEILRDVAMGATVATTRRQARRVADRLLSPTRTQRHAAAFARRRVYVDTAPDGMSWLCALIPTVTAHGIDRSLTRTVKNMPLDELDGRTHSQARADVFAGLLGGVGTPHGVKTKVLVTIPFDRLAQAAQASVRNRPGAGVSNSGGFGADLNATPLVPGLGSIDDATARQLFLDAGAFTRVITDPVSGVVLDMDRRSRRATAAQRDWLALAHGTCVRDGCERLAIDADIDHWCAYHGPNRGVTDIVNLDPLCDPDHALKDTTKLEHHRRDDGAVEVSFPSGHRTTNPFDGMHERVEAVLARGATATRDAPPF
ncbi:DUF222 domain-containing protein [Microbacterium sp. ASV49]|uniref:DUF222 domain-containing protein n=1 Tax=Microbacterium candidum TaxID=3041922 RepID=A0ABT7N3L1_9MICO|nr:DUF222 domain-containing protein [Microbacterium sp. ASV49]MDL9981287.1 DUF222 domain-containing protein [Microbacterium sp. ASV49]